MTLILYTVCLSFDSLAAKTGHLTERTKLAGLLLLLLLEIKQVVGLPS